MVRIQLRGSLVITSLNEIIVFCHCRIYTDITIHERMIADEVRTEAFRLFVLHLYVTKQWRQQAWARAKPPNGSLSPHRETDWLKGK